MKLYFISIILLMASCVSRKTIMPIQKKDNLLSFHISIDSNKNLYVHLNAKFDTGTITVSNPALRPITTINLYDKNNQPIFLPKVKSAVNLEKEVMKLNPNQNFTARYVDLERLVPDHYQEIKRIEAFYYYTSYISNANFLSDTLVVE